MKGLYMKNVILKTVTWFIHRVNALVTKAYAWRK